MARPILLKTSVAATAVHGRNEHTPVMVDVDVLGPSDRGEFPAFQVNFVLAGLEHHYDVVDVDTLRIGLGELDALMDKAREIALQS